jgi:hypothetical protein
MRSAGGGWDDSVTFHHDKKVSALVFAPSFGCMKDKKHFPIHLKQSEIQALFEMSHRRTAKARPVVVSDVNTATQ